MIMSYVCGGEGTDGRIYPSVCLSVRKIIPNRVSWFVYGTLKIIYLKIKAIMFNRMYFALYNTVNETKFIEMQSNLKHEYKILTNSYFSSKI